MSNDIATGARKTARRSRAKKAALLTAAAAAAAALVAGAATWALWSASDAFAGGSISAGDMSFTVGTATWEQATPGVTNPASGTLEETPTDFLTMPGDEIEIRIPVTTTLVGDNLNVGFGVTFADPAAGSGDIAATFYVEDADGMQVAPATGSVALGELASPDGLVGSDAGATDEWTLVVTVEVLGDYDWVDPTAADPAADVQDEWTVGGLVVQLNQVRSGPGYTDGDA
ncbi:hypothetical protein [Microbacterium suaedae]|uniref:hypothetical protein n=1 Tax=Microbacterium suaedae TaxID=2067813 RepID=UPI0013A6129F|nr:hypothetical protein [Microbacterium suaedae]